MRRIRAALAILTILLLSLLFAGPASAGGPTSVLLVAPGNGQTASLYTGSADYRALESLLGASQTSDVAGTAAPAGTGHESGPAVTVTWLIHDVQVWRVDRIYSEADGGPWISTQSVAGGSGSIWDSALVWHTAARGKELATLLDRLGVSPYPSGDGNVPVAGNIPIGGSAGTNVAAPAAPAAAHTGTTGTAGPVWGLAGLAIGVSLTVAGKRLLPRPRTATGEVAVS